ncbi:MAG: iron ABC transporter permease [bacterium]
MVTPKKIWLLSSLGAGLLLLSVCFALGVGSAQVGWGKATAGLIAEWLGGGAALTPSERAILIELRLPRILLTGLVGMSLSVSGAVFQALLRNPLADPFVLGLSGGAAVGALLCIALGMVAPFVTPVASFIGALLTIVLVLGTAGSGGRLRTTTVLLTGVIVNAFCTSIIMLILTMSTEQKIHEMLFWLYGDLSSARYRGVLFLAPLAVLSIGIILAHARGLNILMTGEESALHLGVPVERYKWTLFGVGSLLTGAVVSVSGIIGFVGLIIPHLVRMAFGADHRLLLPLSALLGAVFLVTADAAARLVLAPNEVPVGVVTAALGSPFFILLLRRKGSQWQMS